MKKFPTKAVIKKLAKLDEYYYPIHRCSLFVLPDGKIVGTLDLFDHRNMLELAGSGKLSDQDFFNFMVDAGLVRLVVNDLKILHVNVLTSITQAQKETLQGFGMCDKYHHITIDTNEDFVPNSPNKKAVKYLLGI